MPISRAIPGESPRLSLRNAIGGIAACLLVAACVFTPGRFSSQLDLRKDGAFTFTYKGEMVFVPLMEAEKKATFSPDPCFEEDSFDERECSAEELAEQEALWNEQRASKDSNAAEAADMLLGGFNAEDPEAAEQIAAKIRRQAGYESVTYNGGGVFDVDFAITSRLDHDFVFPSFEGMAMSNAFVRLSRRGDGSVRIEAPGFGPENASAGMTGMMSGLSKSALTEESSDTPKIDGVFVLRTNGEILANNTDEGPVTDGKDQVLTWQANARSQAQPTALIRLAP